MHQHRVLHHLNHGWKRQFSLRRLNHRRVELSRPHCLEWPWLIRNLLLEAHQL